MWLTAEGTTNAVVAVLAVVAVGAFIAIRWRKRRRTELGEVRRTLADIRAKENADDDEIALSPALLLVEREIRAMYRSANDDIARMRKLEMMRTQFLANVSHELKTPIFAIQGYLETLLDGAIKDEAVGLRFLQKAAAHTENLSALLNDLIDISMIESGEMRMSFRYFTLKDYLEDVLARIQPLAEQKGIELAMGEVRDGLKIFGDKERIKQALVNLVQNAVKYTDEGRVDVFVEELKGKRARIVVRDTGVGMTPEDAERIFERFYRVDKARSREVGGTGLGLAIVKHILDAHQTTVEVESEPGKGSEFSFVLRR